MVSLPANIMGLPPNGRSNPIDEYRWRKYKRKASVCQAGYKKRDTLINNCGEALAVVNRFRPLTCKKSEIVIADDDKNA